MRPDFRNQINDDLPLLAKTESNNESQLSDQEVDNNTNNNPSVETDDNKNDVETPIIDDPEMTLGALLNTMNLNKTINRDREIEPPSNKIKSKGPSNFTIILLIIMILLVIGYFVYNLFKPSNKNIDDKKSSSDNISSSTIISKRKYASNDAEAYQDKIISEVTNKVFMFDTTILPPGTPAYRNQNVYLYIDHNQNLKVMIAREQTIVSPRVVGYPVTGFDKLITNLLSIPNPCDSSSPSIYVLTALGELYYLDLAKMKQSDSLTTVYNSIKNGNSETTINLELIKVNSSSVITSFTSINEIQNSCISYPYVLLSNGEMRTINYNSDDNSYSINQRYFGQINYLSRNGNVDYYIYVDKTISDKMGNIISDSNGQNFKFEKIIISNENLDFDDLNSPYVFISTDNKMITVEKNNLLNIHVSEQNVTEIISNLVMSEDGITEIQTYVIKFVDGTTKLISAKKGVTLLSILEMIDLPAE